MVEQHDCNGYELTLREDDRLCTYCWHRVCSAELSHFSVSLSFNTYRYEPYATSLSSSSSLPLSQLLRFSSLDVTSSAPTYRIIRDKICLEANHEHHFLSADQSSCKIIVNGTTIALGGDFRKSENFWFVF